MEEKKKKIIKMVLQSFLGNKKKTNRNSDLKTNTERSH